ncbi:protein kinase [Yinghuangia sp. ASG 101]|uniref:serine/threonine-protein kinase n=1 Tax=Yinghuangia sp. ASG 101 TaxID=2896848 RepID=UPI001E2DCADD|nr:serine/threonine-protein kinase [Yinghuangia sp. ASG 101]UGQ14564.1 protein kinase [Yinghuangia sp. ASG 101]
MTEPTGERLVAERYRLAETLGRGGMGTVWRAHDTVLDRTVAVKEVRVPDDLDDDERERRSARAMREVRAAALVAHPNVVVVHDVVEDGGRPWIVMEYVPGRTLADDLAEGRLSVGDATRVLRQILRALSVVHAADVVHRDIKPANILLAAGGRAVLTDFGIAMLGGSTTITATGTTIGTLEYMAPERAHGLRPGPASDLWSLGATLYEMLEGRSPFRRNGEFATLQAVLDGTYEPPRHAGVLAAVLAGLLIAEPEQRLTADQALLLVDEGLSSADATVGTGDSAVPVVPVPVSVPDEANDPGEVDETADAPAVEDTADGTADDVRAEATGGATGDVARAVTLPGIPEPPKAAPAAHRAGPPPVPAEPPRVGPPAPGPAAKTGGPRAGRSPLRSHPVRAALAVAVIAALTAGVWAYVATTGDDASDTSAGRGSAAPKLTSAPPDGPAVGTAPVGVVTGGVAPGGSASSAEPTSRTTGAAGTPTPGGTPGTAPEPTTGPTTGPGFHHVVDPAGFSVDVPDGWSAAEPQGDRVFFHSPGRSARLGVRVDPPDASGDPYADLAAQDAGGTGSSGTAAYPGYELVELMDAAFRGNPACYWEFTWNDSGTLRRSMNLRYVANGRTFDFWVSGPDTSTESLRATFEAARGSFAPTD